MPTLVVPASVSPCQIDDFPSKCKRTARGKAKIEGGALYVRPASTLAVTDEELTHIKKAHPKVFAQLIVHKTRQSRVEVAEEKAAAEAKAKVEEEAKAEAEQAEKEEAAAKAEAEAKTKARVEAKAKTKAETEAKAKAAAEADEKKKRGSR